MALISIKNWLPSWFQIENKVASIVEIHITRLESVITELTKLNVKYTIEPITRTVNGISSYTLIDGWEKILEIAQKTNPDITEDDMTGFKYKSINALTDFMVKNYTVEEITQESTNYKRIYLEYSSGVYTQIDTLVKKYTTCNPPIEYPKILFVV